MAELDTVILDIDGTLIDSNDAHARAWVDAAAEFGYALDFEEVRPLIGMGGDKILPRVLGLEEESDLGARFKERRGEVFRSKYLPSLRATPGARELVQKLSDDGYAIVVASSASKDDAGALLEKAGVADLIEEQTTSDDAEESKPDPDIVQAALRRAGVRAERALMIGDTPYDVEACRAIGLPILALRCGGWDDHALRGADAVYADPADLLRNYDESPLGIGARRSGTRR